MYLIYDTETTGLPKNFNAPISDSDNWPRCVQIAWQLHNAEGKLVSNHNIIIQPDGFDIPFNAAKIHGITTEIAQEKGIPLADAMAQFQEALAQTEVIIGHNIEFDQNIIGAEFYRLNQDTETLDKPTLDTMSLSTDYCQLAGGRGGGFKSPKLGELHQKLFGKTFDEAHNASADVNATARCFFELVRIGVIPESQAKFLPENFHAFKTHFPDTIQPYDIEIESQVADFNAQKDEVKISDSDNFDASKINHSSYFHFHNHTAYSILSATSRINDLVQKAIDEKMPAVGITDMGNMMGAYKFTDVVEKINKDLDTPIVPIVGCEVYISDRYQQTKFTKDNPDRRYTQLLLAKNKAGYHNLSKISSTGYIEGYYAGYPRVGKEVILAHKENLIATTGSLNSEIPNMILNVGEKNAEEAFVWWKEQFGDDFYVELIRHGLDEEEHVNKVLIEFARKYDVKILAQNNTFYLKQSDAEAHDILLCVRDGEKKDTPIGRGRGFRFGFPNDEFYFKSQEQMASLFEDVPESINNLEEFIQKFEPYHLAQDVLLPKFNIPEEFKSPEDEKDGGNRGENDYLRHLTFEGAKQRYETLTDEIIDRLEFELKTIENTGYPGYFLIVQDFTSQARKMGVSVGPGRGSAAGSAVAYCVGITNVDPIKYDLLFERFLNPDRVSLPDIDIDFDDRGRDKIIQWVVDKYGKDQVAQIITYGTMAGKSAIRDTGRVLDLPLSDTDRIAKKVHLRLNKLFGMDEKTLKEKLSSDLLPDAKEIIKLSEGNDLEAKTINQAKVIEGSIRNTGIHACGVIITPIDIRDLIPVSVAKDSDLVVTQFDNSVVEDAGLLKMDFLGLKTLTIINDAVDLIEQKHGKKLVPDDFPLDDEKTYKEIFQKGRTSGIFQYESPGMQKHLISLAPDKFDDLIAMNALYRPGPIQYIPNFIERKHGREEITYDLPEMEEYLAETYGITVYQEQVMLLSQKLANFTKGEADVLRKAMGKKQRHVLDRMKGDFLERAKINGHPETVLDKIWTDWEAFAQYAFNKSHSTCYAFIAFQTAYLKAHYPAEYMAAVLSNNMNQIKDVSFFMQECKRMHIPVLSPDVNESEYSFSVNDQGAIRFGLGAIKGVGQAAVESIINERKENGKYTSIFDFVQRIDLRQCNKKTFENLILAGAMDELDSIHRARYFYGDENGVSNIEKIIKFGQACQDGGDENQISLFDAANMEIEITPPALPDCPEWNVLQKLNKEKEVVGIYISSHPLDEYRYELEFFKDVDLEMIKGNEEKMAAKNIKAKVIGMITKVQHSVTKTGKDFGIFTIEDYTDAYEIMLFGEDYLKHKHFLDVNRFVLVQLSFTKNRYSNRVYTNISEMNLLQEVLDKFCTSITLNIPLENLDSGTVELLEKITSKNPGETPITMRFTLQNKSFSAKALKKRVNISRELLNNLYEINYLKVKLN